MSRCACRAPPRAARPPVSWREARWPARPSYREAIAAQQNGRLDEAGATPALFAAGRSRSSGRAARARSDARPAGPARRCGLAAAQSARPRPGCGRNSQQSRLGVARSQSPRRGDRLLRKGAGALPPLIRSPATISGRASPAEGRLAEAMAVPQGAGAGAGLCRGARHWLPRPPRQSNPREAVGEFERALEARPGFVQARINYGDALALLERHSDSAAQYEMALALQPGSAPLHRKLADALRALGLCNTAIDHYRRALDLDPRLAGALGGLGIALTEDRADRRGRDVCRAGDRRRAATSRALSQSHPCAKGPPRRSVSRRNGEASGRYRVIGSERPGRAPLCPRYRARRRGRVGAVVSSFYRRQRPASRPDHLRPGGRARSARPRSVPSSPTG